jgi:transcriptional regulator with XRE-family HTH domain
MSDMIHDDKQEIDAEEEQERLSQRLREAREYLGLSQEEVAERLKVPRASISAIETNKRKVSSLELMQLARIYRRSISSLLGEEEPVEELRAEDETFRALFRTARGLSEQDRQEVLRYAQYLREKKRNSTSRRDMEDE